MYMFIVRLAVNWFTNQTMQVKWGIYFSDPGGRAKWSSEFTSICYLP